MFDILFQSSEYANNWYCKRRKRTEKNSLCEVTNNIFPDVEKELRTTAGQQNLDFASRRNGVSQI